MAIAMLPDSNEKIRDRTKDQVRDLSQNGPEAAQFSQNKFGQHKKSQTLARIAGFMRGMWSSHAHQPDVLTCQMSLVLATLQP